MIEYSALLKRTRAYIDEYVGAADEEAGMDDFAKETDSILEVHIAAAARYVAAVVPKNYLAATSTMIDCDDGEVRNDGRTVLYMDLPAGFSRLEKIEVRNSGGSLVVNRPIRTLLPRTDASYGEQWANVEGIGAGSTNPKAYREGMEVEIHSIRTLEGMTYKAVLRYFEIPVIRERRYETLSDALTDVIAMRAASIYMAINDKAAAQAAVQAAADMLNTLIATDGADMPAQEAPAGTQ